MNPNAVKCLIAWTWLALAALPAQAQAQGVYRIVGPDGRISFSDKPPAEIDKATVQGAGGSARTTGGPQLPFELRQVASRYPVTLYSSSACAPCVEGRGLLSRRGIPFTERTVTSNDDTEALQRISGSNSLPLLMIGGQQLKGYSEAEWVQYLDAAGYPLSSQLPAGYRHPAPEPLVKVQKPSVAERRQSSEPPVMEAAPAPDVTPSNPAGIRF
jgi:glutaredoxin